MPAESVLRGRQMVHIMQRLFAIANFTCSGVGDLSLAEYALLLDVSEFGADGVSMRRLERHFDLLEGPGRIVGSLESKELLQRVRDKDDRRSFACCVTSKGRSRIKLLDEVLAVALVESSPSWDEDTLAVLIDRFQQCARINGNRAASTMFPATVLVGLVRYHWMMAHECSVLGTTPLQMAILCTLGTSKKPKGLDYIAARTGLYGSIVEFQLWHLTKVRLAVYEEGFAITERGLKRVEALLAGLSAALNADIEKFGDSYGEAMAEVADYLVFLFG